MTEQQRAPALNKVDVFVSVDVGDGRTRRSLDEERIRADRTKGSYR